MEHVVSMCEHATQVQVRPYVESNRVKEASSVDLADNL
jgi:hypothetical protein